MGGNSSKPSSFTDFFRRRSSVVSPTTDESSQHEEQSRRRSQPRGRVGRPGTDLPRRFTVVDINDETRGRRRWRRVDEPRNVRTNRDRPPSRHAAANRSRDEQSSNTPTVNEMQESELHIASSSLVACRVHPVVGDTATPKPSADALCIQQKRARHFMATSAMQPKGRSSSSNPHSTGGDSLDTGSKSILKMGHNLPKKLIDSRIKFAPPSQSKKISQSKNVSNGIKFPEISESVGLVKASKDDKVLLKSCSNNTSVVVEPQVKLPPVSVDDQTARGKLALKSTSNGHSLVVEPPLLLPSTISIAENQIETKRALKSCTNKISLSIEPVMKLPSVTTLAQNETDQEQQLKECSNSHSLVVKEQETLPKMSMEKKKTPTSRFLQRFGASLGSHVLTETTEGELPSIEYNGPVSLTSLRNGPRIPTCESTQKMSVLEIADKQTAKDDACQNETQSRQEEEVFNSKEDAENDHIPTTPRKEEVTDRVKELLGESSVVKKAKRYLKASPLSERSLVPSTLTVSRARVLLGATPFSEKSLASLSPTVKTPKELVGASPSSEKALVPVPPTIIRTKALLGGAPLPAKNLVSSSTSLKNTKNLLGASPLSENSMAPSIKSVQFEASNPLEGSGVQGTVSSRPDLKRMSSKTITKSEADINLVENIELVVDCAKIVKKPATPFRVDFKRQPKPLTKGRSVDKFQTSQALPPLSLTPVLPPVRITSNHQASRQPLLIPTEDSSTPSNSSSLADVTLPVGDTPSALCSSFESSSSSSINISGTNYIKQKKRRNAIISDKSIRLQSEERGMSQRSTPSLPSSTPTFGSRPSSLRTESSLDMLPPLRQPASVHRIDTAMSNIFIKSLENNAIPLGDPTSAGRVHLPGTSHVNRKQDGLVEIASPAGTVCSIDSVKNFEEDMSDDELLESTLRDLKQEGWRQEWNKPSWNVGGTKVTGR